MKRRGFLQLLGIWITVPLIAKADKQEFRNLAPGTGIKVNTYEVADPVHYLNPTDIYTREDKIEHTISMDKMLHVIDIFEKNSI